MHTQTHLSLTPTAATFVRSKGSTVSQNPPWPTNTSPEGRVIRKNGKSYIYRIYLIYWFVQIAKTLEAMTGWVWDFHGLPHRGEGMHGSCNIETPRPMSRDEESDPCTLNALGMWPCHVDPRWGLTHGATSLKHVETTSDVALHWKNDVNYVSFRWSPSVGQHTTHRSS